MVRGKDIQSSQIKLERNQIYKVLIPGDLEDVKEYSYWVCIGDREDYYVLNAFEQWAIHEGLGDQLDSIEDIDDEFSDNTELQLKHFKQFNGLEAIYYFDKTIEHSKPVVKKNKFTLT